MNKFEDKKREIDKIINKLILQSRNFTFYSAFDYGMKTYIQRDEKTSEFTYDYDYFNLAKCTKIMISIRQLLKLNHNEDVFILIRSIFESYLSTRYFNENDDKVNDFIFNPTMLALAHYNIYDGQIMNRDKDVVGEIINPSKFKTGRDKTYYNDFYAYLCMFAHANYGISNCYSDGSGGYSLNKENYSIEVRLFAIFAFTKLFEHVVTVEGEDFYNDRTEKICYELVKSSIELQRVIFDDVIMAYMRQDEEFYKFRNKRMVTMLRNMKKSLDEELGSLKK